MGGKGIRIHLPLFIGAHFGTALNGKEREGERKGLQWILVVSIQI